MNDPGDLVDLVAATFGCAHRPVHAVGTGLVGSFTPALGAATFCRAPIFAGAPIPVTARFSNGNGTMAGDERLADARGLAVRFHCSDSGIDNRTDNGSDVGPDHVAEPAPGTALDLIAMTLPCFFARTPDDFADFCRLSVPSPDTGVVDASAMTAWLATHPTSLTAVEMVAQLGIDVSYAAITYFSVHAFNFLGAGAAASTARFSWVPDTPIAQLPASTDLSKEPLDRLRRELTSRVRTGQTPGFQLRVQVQGPNDAADDPTQLWTSTDVRTLGHLTLSGFVHDQFGDCEALRFNPTRLIDGIEATDDPILHARGAAYERSGHRRNLAFASTSRLLPVPVSI